MAEPQSLWQMLGGGGSFRNALGEEDPKLGFADALAQRQNSLIGMGGALLSGGGWGGAMQGYAQGAQQDANIGYRLAQMKQHAQDKALQQAQQKQAQSNWERSFGLQQQQFARGDVTEAQKAMRDVLGPNAAPEAKAEFMKQYYAPKTEGDWSVVQVPHPQYPGETIPAWGNKRTQEIKPFTGFPGAAPADATAGPAAIPAAPPGSDPKEWRKEQTKLEVQKRAAAEAQKKQAGSIDPVTEDIDRAINQTINAPGMVTGGFGKMMTYVPGSQARDVSGLTDTIKANASLDKLQQMRAASPSGASGLGAVTQGEHKLLQDAIGALDQSQTADQFLYNLDRVKRIRHEIVHGPGTAPPPRFQTPAGQRPGGTAGPAASDKKTIGGKSYTKRNGQWFED